MDVKCKSRTFEHTKHHLANKKYVVLIEGVEVTIKLTEQEFNRLYEMKYMDENKKNFIEINEATDWLKKYVVGNLTKLELDQERNKEINSEDMMQ